MDTVEQSRGWGRTSVVHYLGAGLPPELTCEIASHLPKADFLVLRQVSKTVNAHIHKPFVKVCAVERGTVEINLTKPSLESFMAISVIKEVALQVEKLDVCSERPSKHGPKAEGSAEESARQ